jgi:hypothetical protein
MNSEKLRKLQFYDGRKAPIDKERLARFDVRSVIDRYYQRMTMEASKLISELGSIHIDYTNIQHWSEEIPDIDERSARLFTLWAEDIDTKEVLVILRGYYILVPFQFGTKELEEYHFDQTLACYPMAVISSFRTIFKDVDIITELLDKVKVELGKNWKTIRKKMIDTLEKTALWERYVYALDEITFISFICPTFDRELVTALKNSDFRTTGILQIMASPTSTYDQMSVQTHLNDAKKLIQSHKK